VLWPRTLKRLTPTSLYGRTLLIIILPVALMQAAVTWAFFDAHWQTVTSRLSAGLAGDIAWVAEEYEQAPSPASLQRLAERAERRMDLSVALQEGQPLPTERRHAFLAAVDDALERALRERLDRPFWFDTTRYPAFVDIRVQAPGGTLRFIAPRDRAIATQGGVFVLWLSGATVLLTLVAVLFIRNQIRAIERLAAAADAFGRGAEAPFFKPHGAREVRQAAQAFIAMKGRIGRHIEQRTTLLASVSHDLRTPLTRLKLELAMAAPGPQTEAMKRDLAEMEHMIDEYLDFARGEGGEALQLVEIASVLDSLTEDARRLGAQVEVASQAELTAQLRPNAFRRALANLVGNASVHGRRVALAARRLPSGALEVAVDDDGPGIPPDRYEEAFRPFQRLDDARNQNRKGVGLGLAIARDIARAHGGDITLDRSPLGGLRAVMRLPG
jgi:two-component system osmolarity sensor histidine kinase EnvZ